MIGDLGSPRPEVAFFSRRLSALAAGHFRTTKTRYSIRQARCIAHVEVDGTEGRVPGQLCGGYLHDQHRLSMAQQLADLAAIAR